jgi:hypothetical protein
LPLVARNYKSLVNGAFEQGWLGWTHGQGPFLGHGSGLSQSIVLTGTYQALLGDPSYDNKNLSIPVGYAYMAQEFTVPPGTPILSISYRVHSLDTSFGTSTSQYYDTFEVSINKPSDQITDTERDGPNGCQGSALSPDNVTRTPTTDGLIACAGAPAASAGGTPWDSGWRMVQLDLSAFASQNVTLYFANWSREYGSFFPDDHAYFNTYTYVDDVMFVQGP